MHATQASQASDPQISPSSMPSVEESVLRGVLCTLGGGTPLSPSNGCPLLVRLSWLCVDPPGRRADAASLDHLATLVRQGNPEARPLSLGPAFGDAVRAHFRQQGDVYEECMFWKALLVVWDQLPGLFQHMGNVPREVGEVAAIIDFVASHLSQAEPVARLNQYAPILDGIPASQAAGMLQEGLCDRAGAQLLRARVAVARLRKMGDGSASQGGGNDRDALSSQPSELF